LEYSFLSAFDCNGTLSNPDAREKVLNYHNEQRKLVADGDMHNKAGYIPQAGNMEKMIYDCELESKAEAEITSCPTTDKFAGLTTAYNYEKMAEGKAPLDAATTWVTTYTDGSVAWPRKNILTATQLGNRKFPKFGKMINANATAVGCAYKDCTFNAAKEAIILCVYDAA
uniref:SCP domain-containing protein n=1 Tax=Nippostrongylus brasiliensis TaxID=27835 RepID=A0A0N4XRV8_NIPBR